MGSTKSKQATTDPKQATKETPSSAPTNKATTTHPSSNTNEALSKATTELQQDASLSLNNFQELCETIHSKYQPKDLYATQKWKLQMNLLRQLQATTDQACIDVCNCRRFVFPNPRWLNRWCIPPRHKNRARKRPRNRRQIMVGDPVFFLLTDVAKSTTKKWYYGRTVSIDKASLSLTIKYNASAVDLTKFTYAKRVASNDVVIISNQDSDHVKAMDTKDPFLLLHSYQKLSKQHKQKIVKMAKANLVRSDFFASLLPGLQVWPVRVRPLDDTYQVHKNSPIKHAYHDQRFCNAFEHAVATSHSIDALLNGPLYAVMKAKAKKKIAMRIAFANIVAFLTPNQMHLLILEKYTEEGFIAEEVGAGGEVISEGTQLMPGGSDCGGDY